MQIIQDTNPMLDEYHRWIRSTKDIKTFEEVLDDPESFVYWDFSRDDAYEAYLNGKVTVYSSKPLENWVFVSTSQNMARDYAWGGKIYSKTVDINDVAWLDWDEGQLATTSNVGMPTKTIKFEDIMWNKSQNLFDEEDAKNYGLTAADIKALKEYNWSKYSEINKYLRQGYGGEQADNISKALAKLPSYEGVTYRWTSLKDEVYNQRYANLKPGDIITEKWFTSSTIDGDRLYWFASYWGEKTPWHTSVTMAINSKNWKYSLNSYEKEILFDKWTQFEVTKIVKKPDWSLTTLYLNEI